MTGVQTIRIGEKVNKREIIQSSRQKIKISQSESIGEFVTVVPLLVDALRRFSTS
jgi:hypothetical protein